MEEEEIKIEDVGSLAQKIPSQEWPFWKKIIIFLTIALILIVGFILIIVLSNSKKDEDKKDEEKKDDDKQDDEEPISIDESKVSGDLICFYNIRDTQSKTPLIGSDFSIPKNSFIVIDDQLTKNFEKEYKFTQQGEHKIRFVFYEPDLNLNNMFKDISSLVSVQINQKNLILIQ